MKNLVIRSSQRKLASQMFFHRSWCRFENRRIGKYVRSVHCTRNCITVSRKSFAWPHAIELRCVPGHCMFSSRENGGKAGTEVRRQSQETCQLLLHHTIGLRVIVRQCNSWSHGFSIFSFYVFRLRASGSVLLLHGPS
jgi:hypothetical protein